MHKIICWFLLPVSFMTVACSSNKPISANTSYTNLSYAAWNEDTISSYALYLYKNSQFRYNVSERDSNNRVKKHFYTGAYKATRNDIYLLYTKNNIPPGVTNYLIVETSGNYFIQYFTNNRKRIFLRIQGLRHRVASTYIFSD